MQGIRRGGRTRAMGRTGAMTGAVSLPGQDQREEPMRPAPAPRTEHAGVHDGGPRAATGNDPAMARDGCHQRRRTRKNTELS